MFFCVTYITSQNSDLFPRCFKMLDKNKQNYYTSTRAEQAIMHVKKTRGYYDSKICFHIMKKHKENIKLINTIN